MAQHQSEYPGAGRRTDEYVNRIYETDEYGNIIRRTDDYGDPIHQPVTGVPETTVGYGEKQRESLGDKLRRSGSSSSSSSSEDDGQGGRRKKKGLKEKITGVGHKDDRPHATSTTTSGGGYSAEEHHEKKGIIEKIKEKIPGTHAHEEHRHHQD